MTVSCPVLACPQRRPERPLLNPRGGRGSALDSGVGHLLLHARQRSAVRTRRVCLGRVPLPLARLRWNWGSAFICSARPVILHAPNVTSNEDTRPRSPAPDWPSGGEQFHVLPVQAAGATGRCVSTGRAPRLPAAQPPGTRGGWPFLSHRAAGTRSPLLLSTRRAFPTETRRDG